MADWNTSQAGQATDSAWEYARSVMNGSWVSDTTTIDNLPNRSWPQFDLDGTIQAHGG